MGDKIQKVTNSCGETIEVGHRYIINNVAPENACSQRESGSQVKVVEIRNMGGIMMARLEAPKDLKPNEIYLSWIVVDRLYTQALVSSTFRPLESYTSRIRFA